MKLTNLLTTLLLVFLFACDKDKNGTQKQVELQSVGFTGTLPDGRTFSKTGIVATSGLSGGSMGIDSSYIESHIIHVLSVSDTVAGITLVIDLPHVNYRDENLSKKDLKAIARKYYPYQAVKEKLAVGNKILVNGQNPDYTKSFRFQVNDDINYNDFLSSGPDQTGSYLKVTDLIESTEPDPVLGQVKTLEVIFDLDVKVYQAVSQTAPPSKKFKGILRVKYREV